MPGLLQDVVGINTSHKGLSVRLLRSASLLGLLHLYRFIFVVGMLQVRPTLLAPHLAVLMLQLAEAPAPCQPNHEDRSADRGPGTMLQH